MKTKKIKMASEKSRMLKKDYYKLNSEEKWNTLIKHIIIASNSIKKNFKIIEKEKIDINFEYFDQTLEAMLYIRNELVVLQKDKLKDSYSSEYERN